MQLCRSIKKIRAKISCHSVVTIGNYDGIHLGHQEILQRLVFKAKELNLPSVVVIFEPQPEEYFNSQPDCARLTSLREKIRLFATYQVDYILCLKFNSTFASLSGSDFIKKLLIDALNVQYLVVGDDFVFGKKREGNFALLQELAQQYFFSVEQMSSYKIHGMRVSSTLIRMALQQGNLPIATAFLGRPYAVFGRVVHGSKIGRSLGFPTANVYLPHKILPISGVYIVKVHGINSATFHGVANIGFRPTVGGATKTLEVFIFDFTGDLYSKRIEVEFVKKLRDEIKFASFEQLRQQITYDVIQAKQYFENY